MPVGTDFFPGSETERGGEAMKTGKERDLFENCDVTQAVFRLAFPTVIGQIILVIYNIADTFFVGLTGNDAMLAAVPTHTVFTGLSIAFMTS